MLTPSFPTLSRPLCLPVYLARFPAARFWLKDESLEDGANLPDPDVIAQEIVEDLQAALAQFAEIASDSENAVHTAHSQLCSPKAHRAQDQPGSATPATDRRKDSRAAATNHK